MIGLGRCAPCAGQMTGTRGLAAIVMEPLRGGLANGETSAVDELMAGGGALAPGAMMAGSAISGGLIGGLSAGTWKAAGTGALLTSGLAGLGAGISLMAFGTTAADPVVPAGAAGLGGMSTQVTGSFYALAGAALLTWGGYRAYKAIKRR